MSNHDFSRFIQSIENLMQSKPLYLQFPLILASQSARRAELLSQIYADFTIAHADVDESIAKEENAEGYVQRLAIEKTKAVAAEVGDECIVIGGDTCIEIDGRIIGKPSNKSDAIDTLLRLSGRSHSVLSAIALCCRNILLDRLVRTTVTFRTLANDEIERYCDTDEPYDKAGSYAIQGYGGVFVRKINGSYSSVVGLPLCETYELLLEINEHCLEKR